VLRYPQLLKQFRPQPVLRSQGHERPHRLVLALAVARQQLQDREHFSTVHLRDPAALDGGHSFRLLRELRDLDRVEVVAAAHAGPLHETKQHRPILPDCLARNLAQSSPVEVLDARWCQSFDVREARQELDAPSLLAAFPVALTDDRWLDRSQPFSHDRRERAALWCVYSSTTGNRLGVDLRTDPSSFRKISRARRELVVSALEPEPADLDPRAFVFDEPEPVAPLSSHRITSLLTNMTRRPMRRSLSNGRTCLSKLLAQTPESRTASRRSIKIRSSPSASNIVSTNRR
jgi:hypothetical protein